MPFYPSNCREVLLFFSLLDSCLKFVSPSPCRLPCQHGAKNEEFYKNGRVGCKLTTQPQQWDWLVSFFALVSAYLVSPPQDPLPAQSLPCGRYVLVSACLHEFSCQIPSLTSPVVYLRCRCHDTRVFILDFTNTLNLHPQGYIGNVAAGSIFAYLQTAAMVAV